VAGLSGAVPARAGAAGRGARKGQPVSSPGSKVRRSPEDGWPLVDDRVKLVKQAVDIVDVVGSYLPLRPAGQTYKGLCPFHDDTRPSFDVDPRRQRYRCWACNQYGDVISFVQEFEKVSFPEALELLARRAGINLENSSGGAHGAGRAVMLDVARWAAQQFHECLLDSPLAEEARCYLGGRGLKGETVRGWLLGYAPRSGDWLVGQAEASKVPLGVLEQVGLIARRDEGAGFYDRFRDRVQFPIRDVRGQVVGFGGRILPTSPLSTRGPKYYNSCDTPLFSKSEQLYGLDQARHAAARAGYLAVVEGYTDVLMAHQLGVGQVVATMGTALNGRHVRQLRRFAPRVVLVFDADAGGATGADRALEIFAGHEVDLAVATLPAGLDPCDLLVQQGPEPFRRALESAVDALEFKLNQVLAREEGAGVEGRRRAVDAVLGVIALAPRLAGQAGAVKTELMVNRIAQRMALKEETVWARLEELRHKRRGSETDRPRAGQADEGPRQAPAAPQERALLELLLAWPELVDQAKLAVAPEEVEHPGLRRLLEGLYALHDEGLSPGLDLLRPRLDHPRLTQKALELQDVGRAIADPPGCLRQLLASFRERRARPVKEELKNQLQAAGDHEAALELLRRLQTRGDELGPDTSSRAG
jgi:DNA primase